LDIDDLAHENLLLLEDGHCLRQQTLDVCHLAGASEKAEFRATSLETLRQMVAANVGVTLLPTLSVQPPVAQPPSIRLLPFREMAPSRRIAMFWRRSSAMDEFLRRFAESFRALPEALLQPTRPVAASRSEAPPDTL